MKSAIGLGFLALRLAPALFIGVAPPASAAADLISSWTETHGSRARLVAGRDVASQRLFAGIEIDMPAGWKTYWKSPGDAGGVPPRFDWSESRNLKGANVRFPVPERLIDAAGETLGYQDRVIFPVELTPDDPAQPIDLKLLAEFGVCKDICIPTEAALDLRVPPAAAAPPLPVDLAEALNRVPRGTTERRDQDPELLSARVALDPAAPKITLSVRIPGSAADAEAFAEAPAGVYVPSPRRTATEGDIATFEIDLSQDVDIAALKGQEVTLTFAGRLGRSTAAIRIE